MKIDTARGHHQLFFLKEAFFRLLSDTACCQGEGVEDVSFLRAFLYIETSKHKRHCYTDFHILPREKPLPFTSLALLESFSLALKNVEGSFGGV